MYIAWFAFTLVLAAFYGLCIRRVVGYVRSPLLHWSIAVVLTVSFFIGAVLTTRFQVSLSHDGAVAAHAVLLFLCGWLGLRYWLPWRLWDIPATALALVMVMFFFIDPAKFNNGMLLMLSLGIGAGGYYVTKGWLRAFFVLMGALDAYMVWGTNLSESLAQPPCAFPVSLMGAFSVPFMQISMIDVALSAFALIGIQRHRGMLRSVLFGASCIALVPAIAFCAEQGARLFLVTPFLVFVAPLVLLFLHRFRRPSASSRLTDVARPAC